MNLQDILSKSDPKKLNSKIERLKGLKDKGSFYLLEEIEKLEEKFNIEDILTKYTEIKDIKEKLENDYPAFEKIIREITKPYKGDDGYSPIKGEDYFDGEKGEKGDKGDKGENGKDGADGKDGLDGKDGVDGENGKDGADGKDADETIIIEKVLSEIPSETSETIKEKLESLSGENRLDAKAIKNLPIGVAKMLSNLVDVDLTGLQTDAQGNYILNQINDEVSSATSTYSSSKIDNLIANIPQGGGSSKIFYLTGTEVFTGYNLLSGTPETAGEIQESVTVANGEGLIDSYVTNPLGVTSLPNGNWGFNIWANADHLGGVSNVIVRVYKRTSGGTETLIFEETSQEITSTTYQELIFEYIQATATTLLPTDMLVVKFYGVTTRNNPTTISIFHGSSERYSHIHTPLQNIAITWEHLAINGKTDGVDIATTGGTYLVYTYNGNTIYRFLSTAEDSNGYNVEDSFYSTLTSGTLSDLIITRG
jgi:hypothetical protein